MTEGFVVVRIPPSAVLSHRNAPAIPASCLPVKRSIEFRDNGIPRVAVPTPLDEREDDPEFALAFALTVQMLAVLSVTNSGETDLTLIQGPWTDEQVVPLSAKPTPGVCSPGSVLGRERGRLAALSSLHSWVYSGRPPTEPRSDAANGT